MPGRSKKSDDVIAQQIAANINIRRQELGWTKTFLASLIQHTGCERTGLQRMLKNGRGIPPNVLSAIAHALGVTTESLYGATRPREIQGWWSPWYHDCQTKLIRFAEHQEIAKTFDTYDTLPSYARMTLAVQSLVNYSRWGQISLKNRGERIIQNYTIWGKSRFEDYLARGKNDGPTIRTVMLRGQFQRLVELDPPFDLCSLYQVAECLEYLKSRCVHERGFRLLLVDDKKLIGYPDLQMQLNAYEAIGVLGKNFMFTKSHDATVFWSEKREAVDYARQLLARVRSLAAHDVTEMAILAELDYYHRRLDQKIEEAEQQLLSEDSSVVKAAEWKLRKPK